MISRLKYEDSVLCVNISQAELSIFKDREQFKSVQLFLLVVEPEWRWALQRVLANAFKTRHYLISWQPTRVLPWCVKLNKSSKDYCGIVSSCADTLDQWLMITTFTSAVNILVAISSVYIPSHMPTYAVLIPSKPASHDPSLAGLHAFISDPGYPSQHQRWRNIICPDVATCTLRQHLHRVDASMVRRR